MPGGGGDPVTSDGKAFLFGEEQINVDDGGHAGSSLPELQTYAISGLGSTSSFGGRDDRFR